MNIEFIPINIDLAYESMRIAQNYKITYYDGIHATLSKNNKAVLITQDKELLKKIGWAESIDNFLNRIEKIE